MEAAVIRRLGFRVRRKLKTFGAYLPSTPPDRDEFLREINIDNPGQLLDKFPMLFDGVEHPATCKKLLREFPVECERLEQVARNASQHKFDLLGSGQVDLGSVIEWSLDFKSGKRWSKGDYRLQKLVDLHDRSDVKVPWELSRCNHFVQMALAFLITGENEFPRKFENQVTSWCEQNEFEQSINWTCAMETAFRCINWLAAYKMFSNQWEFLDDFKSRLIVELFKGGKHIWNNLENAGYGFNTNHYLSDLVGLLFLGELFKETRLGSEWRKFAFSELEKEITAFLQNRRNEPIAMPGKIKP